MSVVENPEYLDVDVPALINSIELSTIRTPIERSCIILLNQDITVPNFTTLWKSYKLRICGDGGANRLFDYFSSDSKRSEYIPDYIIGDFDSLRPDVREWYASYGVCIIPQTTQWATDISKCVDLTEVHFALLEQGKKLDISKIDHYDGIIKLHESLKTHTSIQVIIVGAIDGRFDHTIHSITLLIKLADTSPNLKIYFITATDLIFLIPKGVNYLDYKNSKELFHGSNTGLLPLNGPVILTTKGLKWDVVDWPSSMSGAVSSSNRLVGKEGIIIETDGDFVLNIEISYDKF